jgi:hypothetical protein
MKLTKSEISNLIDALEEWYYLVLPKQLQSNETGLTHERYEKLIKKLLKGLK